MVTQRTIQALIIIWHKLPRLVGASWTEVLPGIRDKLIEILACEDEVDRDWLVFDVLEILKPYQAAVARVDEVRHKLGIEPDKRGDGKEPAPVPGWSELKTGIKHRLDPEVTARYTDVTAPGRLPLGKRGVVTVGLTREPSRHSVADAKPLLVPLDQTLEVHLVALSPAIEILGKEVKQLVVDRDADTEPVVFYLLGHELGQFELRIVFRQDGLPIKDVPLAIEICEASKPEEPADAAASELEIGGGCEAPPDLDLQVLLSHADGRDVFHYVLHSHNGAAEVWYHTISGLPVMGSVDSYRQRLWAKLVPTAPERDDARVSETVTPELKRRRLEAIGEQLFEDLLPKELQDFFETIQRHPIRTFHVTSGEPWIPWELLKPPADDGGEEKLLCESFQITRWLAGQGQPARSLQVRRLACIEAAHAVEEKPLKGPVEDHRYLSRLTEGTDVEDRSLANATLEEVSALLDGGGIDLWHFAGHGEVDEDDADAAAIRLMKNKALRPIDLDRRRQRKIAANHPLVFLNVSGAARQGWGLTGLTGWVSAWVERSRCGFFVAPQCSVDDELAHLFSRTFYEALRRGETIGQAALEARRAVKAENPGDPTWLAYSVYGHPNARVGLRP